MDAREKYAELRRRHPGISAGTLWRWARETLEQDERAEELELEWEERRHGDGIEATFQLEGFTVYARLEPDYYASRTDWLGDFSSEWRAGAVQLEEWNEYDPNTSRRPDTYRYWHPAQTLEERRAGYTAAGYSRSEAELRARADLRADYKRARSDEPLAQASVSVRLEGVELATAGIGGIDADYRELENEATRAVLDLAPEAVEQAREQLEKLTEAAAQVTP